MHGGRRTSAPRARSAPWCTCTAQLGGEPGRLPLPVADQRHRADQQRRPGLRRVGRRAARASARSCPAPCRRRAPRRGRATGGRPARPARAAGTAAACPWKPAAGRPGPGAVRPAPASRSPSAPSAVTAAPAARPGRPRSARPSRSSSATVSSPAGAEQPQPGGEPLRVQLDPLAAQPDQRGLQRGQRGQLRRATAAGRRAPTPSGSRPARPGRAALAVATVPGAVRLLAPAPGAEPGAGPLPPGRQQDAESGGVQHRRAVAEEPVGALGVQLQRRRAWRCAARRPAPARAGWPGPARPAASPAG